MLKTQTQTDVAWFFIICLLSIIYSYIPIPDSALLYTLPIYYLLIRDIPDSTFLVYTI